LSTDEQTHAFSSGNGISREFTALTIWRLRLVYPICQPPEAINAHSTDSLLFQEIQKSRPNLACGLGL